MKEKKEETDSIELKLLYGNRHQLIANPKTVTKDKTKLKNENEWTMYVKFADKSIQANLLIEKVRYHLHEDFGAKYQDAKAVSDSTFEITHRGWGVFTIPIVVYFRRETGLPLEQR